MHTKSSFRKRSFEKLGKLIRSKSEILSSIGYLILHVIFALQNISIKGVVVHKKQNFIARHRHED